MKILLCFISLFLLSCVVIKDESSNELTSFDYDINVYQPPCQIITDYNRQGAIVAQFERCPPVEFVCHLYSTGERIKCPIRGKKGVQEDVYRHECIFIESFNQTLRPEEEHLRKRPQPDNPFCK